jgi:hypothetical protein
MSAEAKDLVLSERFSRCAPSKSADLERPGRPLSLRLRRETREKTMASVGFAFTLLSFIRCSLLGGIGWFSNRARGVTDDPLPRICLIIGAIGFALFLSYLFGVPD